MKKIVLLLFVMMVFLTGCFEVQHDEPAPQQLVVSQQDRFVAMNESYIIRVSPDDKFGERFYLVKDTKTDLLYLYLPASGYRGATLCPLYGPAGLPMKD